MDGLTSSQLLTLIMLSSYANKDGECWPSQEELSIVTKLTRRTINTILKELCIKGYIESQSRFTSRGQKDTSIYKIIVDPSLLLRPRKPKAKVIPMKPKTTEERLTDVSWADEQIEVAF